MTHLPHSCKNVIPNLKLIHNLDRIGRNLLVQAINYSKNTDDESANEKEEQKSEDGSKVSNGEKKEYPKEPTTCCMSGCANCVWLEYAEKLSEYYKDGGEKAINEIKEKVSDENIKAFLLHEIRMRNKK